MKSKNPLVKLPGLLEGVILERTSLFTVAVRVGDEKTIAYLNNTGRLIGLVERGRVCYLTANSPKAKIRLRIIGVRENEHASLIDTSLQERSFLVAQRQGLLPWLLDCRLSERNVKIGDSLIDYAFDCHGRRVLVELKSAVMRLPGDLAGYPDAPTPRGRRQIRELGRYVERGGVGIVVFVAGIPGSKGFKLYCNEDRYIGSIVREAYSSGVIFKAIGVYLDPFKETVVLENPDLPVDLDCD